MIENLENEIWKNIEGSNGLYQISNKGRVKSLIGKDKLLKTFNCGNKEYLIVNLTKMKKTKTIHRLVALHFCQIPEELKDIPIDKLCVNHKDENKENNCASNLEWCTTEYNNNYGTRIERIVTKTKNGKCSKQVFQYDKKMNLIAMFPSSKEVERQLGFKHSKVCACCNGSSKTYMGFIWSHTKKVLG